MKVQTILTALAVLAAALAHPAQAEFTRHGGQAHAKGEVTHLNGVALPPIQTVAQARAETEKRLAAIKAAEAKVAALDTRPSSLATGPQDLFYTGKPYLEETGQYVFLFRHYDPELGRWTTSDPSGFPDWANNYLYSNSPVAGVDPDGLAWSLIDYVEHFYFGSGGVTLSDIGHLAGVQSLARGAGGALTGFGDLIARYAADMIKPYNGSFQLSRQQRFDQYSSVSYPLGRAGVSGYFVGSMTSTPSSSGVGGTYTYTGTATIWFADTFSDPLNVLEYLYGDSNTTQAPDWVSNAANLGGTPFAITASWLEPFTGVGAYE